MGDPLCFCARGSAASTLVPRFVIRSGSVDAVLHTR